MKTDRSLGCRCDIADAGVDDPAVLGLVVADKDLRYRRREGDEFEAVGGWWSKIS
jgi:hypothetical protein